MLEQLLTHLSARGFEMVTKDTSPSQLRLGGRVHPKMMDGWHVLQRHLLLVERDRPWAVDLSKHYILAGDNRYVYKFRFIFQAKDWEKHLPDLVSSVASAPKAKVILSEQPLVGAGASRNAVTRGKGAQSALAPIVGPLALRNR